MMILSVVLAVLAAPAAAADESALSIAARYARFGGDCARLVFHSRVEGFPVPVKTAVGLRYRLFYYPVISGHAYAPTTVAQFSLTGGVSCRPGVILPTDTGAALGPELSPKVAKMSYDKYQDETAKLYAALERTAAAFDAGKRDKAAEKDFLARFDALSEPGLRPHYRALSPDFWAWLEQKKP